MGGRSRAAAQLMAGSGFKEVYNLKGGIKAWQGGTAVGPAEMGMSFLRGDETSEEIILLAYGMEEGLRDFYETLAEEIDDSEVVGVLTKLAKVETKHKQNLFDLYLTLDPSVADRETFESDILSKAMEGGFTTDEFLEENRDSMQTVPDVLNIAMMLETQALDLYMRYAQKAENEKSKSILLGIAEEEKGHLAGLGQLMEERA
ncbi:MAG: sulfurtransferase [Deltaproteobacteria bacterium]|nr:sulfurtransferase [Deltaproteobacteria bacterium]